jgi:hypothetical protein
MPPFAVCLNTKCTFLFDMQESREKRFRVPPHPCPICSARVVLYCLNCRFPLLQKPAAESARCEHCSLPLKRDPAKASPTNP